MPNINIKVYSDPGHAWGAVKRILLDELGVADKISRYSYQNGATVYLEEDCDLPLVVAAIKDSGSTVTFIEKHTDRRSPIRSYASYSDIRIDPLFKQLDDDEIVIFRQWARTNYKPGTAINDLWHPVVREECRKMNEETS